MLCIPNTDICIDPVVLSIILAVIGIIAIVVLVRSVMGSQSQTSDEGISHRVASEDTTDTDQSDNEDVENPAPKVRQQVPFDTIEDMTCILVVTEVNNDEEEVHGKFVVKLPFGATNIDPHYDSDNYEVAVEYDLGTSHGLEVYFDVAEPMDEDALAGYSWTIDSVEAEAKPA